MGGKRSDNYDVDPSTPGNADPRTGNQDEHIATEAKQKVSRTRVADEESLIPTRGTNPALADLQAKREQREDAGEDES